MNYFEYKMDYFEYKMEAEKYIMQLKDRIAQLEGTITHYELRDLEKEHYIAELEKDGKVCATCGGLVYDAVLPQTNAEPVGKVIEIEETYGHTFRKRKVKRVQWSVDVEIGTLLYTTPQTKPLSGDDWQPYVKFEEGVFKFDLPNGDEFVIVPSKNKAIRSL